MRRVARDNWKPWTSTEDAELRRLHAQHMTFARMGQILNRSPSSCNSRAHMMGLKREQGRPISAFEVIANTPPTLPYVPGISVTGRYQMRLT